jgi:hypothetical protein
MAVVTGCPRYRDQEVTDSQIEKRLAPIRAEIESIKTAQASANQPAAGTELTRGPTGLVARIRTGAESNVVAILICVASLSVMIWQVKAPQSTQNEDERFWLKMDKHILDQVKVPLEAIQMAQQSQTGDLRELKGTVDVMARILLPQALPRQLKKQAEFNQPDFEKNTRAVAQTMNVAAAYGIVVPAKTIEQLADRMAKAPPEEVPFLLAGIINLKSIAPLREMGLFNQVANQSTPCVANPPARVSGASELVPGTDHVFKLRNKEFKNCKQVLDGTFWDSVKFTHCLLIYQGGNVGWRFFFTEGSLFRVDLPEHPTLLAKETLGQILPQASSSQIQLTQQFKPIHY